MTADQILALTTEDYGKLFPDRRAIRDAFTNLLKVWHPDRNKEPRAAQVTAKIVALHKRAVAADQNGSWIMPNRLRAKKDGRDVEFHYLRKAKIPAGEIYIGRKALITVAGKGMEDLVLHAATTIGSLPAVPAKMQEEFSRLLPKVDRTISVANGHAVSIAPGMVRLRDLIDKTGPLDPKHVAWVMSGAYNLACYLELSGITHLGIDLDHVFVKPETHEVALLAGWEFAALRHAKPKAATPTAAQTLGSSLSVDPTDRRHHLRLIRALGRAALGDPSGSRLTSRSDIPRPYARWLQLPPGRSAQPEYEAWGHCLVESFGPRRFQALSITHSDIYGS